MLSVLRTELSIALKSSGISLAAVSWGNPNSTEKWLAIHGWLDNAATFDLLIPRILESNQNIHIVCVDLCGHGRSDPRQNGAYHFVDYVADASFFVDELGWENFSLLGHSLGGAVCSILAGTFPSRVQKLVIIESLGPWPTLAEDVPENLALSLTQKPSRDRRVFASVEEAALRRSEGDIAGTVCIEAAKVICSRGLVEAADGGFMWSCDPAVKRLGRLRLTNDMVGAFLQRITAPTLVIFTHDGLLKPFNFASRFCGPIFSLRSRIILAGFFYVMQIIHKLQPSKVTEKSINFKRRILWARGLAAGGSKVQNLKFVTLPKGGHHPHLVVPECVSAVINPWLKNNSKL